jgi:hypothetical protein
MSIIYEVYRIRQKREDTEKRGNQPSALRGWSNIEYTVASSWSAGKDEAGRSRLFHMFHSNNICLVSLLNIKGTVPYLLVCCTDDEVETISDRPKL